MKFFALIAAVSANQYDSMNEDELLVNLESTSPPLSPPRPEVTVTPLLPRPLPSRTSKRPLPLESSRDLMTDNHSSRSPERRRPSKVCSHRSTIWREDSVSCNPLSQSSRTPSRPSRRSSMSEEWERNEQPSLCRSGFISYFYA